MTDKQKSKLVDIHTAVSFAMGDTDPDTTGMSQAEIREECPLLYACQELAKLIGKAPWDRFKE